MKKEPQNPSERLSLEQWLHKAATASIASYTIKIRIESAVKFDSVKLKALESYHSQEMKFMQEEIDSLKHWNTIEEPPLLSGKFLVRFEQFGINGFYQDILTYHHLEDGWVLINPEYKGMNITHWKELPETPSPLTK